MEKKWGRLGGLPLPQKGDKLGSTLFGIINLIGFLDIIVLISFFLGFVLSLLLPEKIIDIMWKVIIYGGLIIWIGGGILGFPIAIIYHGRYRSWKHVILTSIAFIILLYFGYYFLTHFVWQ